jgi:hypothetical protein
MKKLFSLFLIFSAFSPLGALDLWSHPEAAEKNSLFLDIHAAGLSFKSGFAAGLETLEFHAEYLPPLPLPLSFGVFLKAPNPNLKSFGTRVGYHLNLLDRKTDLYFFHRFDFGFIRNNLLLKYGDTATPVHFYDFRFGLRRVFNQYLALVLEADYKASGFSFGLSFKFL